jgi:hypothetical protein
MNSLFDDVSRIVASPVSRRRALTLVGQATGGAVLAVLGLRATSWGFAPCGAGQIVCAGKCCSPGETCCNNKCCAGPCCGGKCCEKHQVCCDGKCLGQGVSKNGKCPPDGG